VRDQGALSRNTGPEGSNSRYGVVARSSAAGILFPTCIVAGYLLGKWLGGAIGIRTWPAFAGAALGAVAGFWNLYRLLRGLEDRGGRP
jgi:hypothetical protein